MNELKEKYIQLFDVLVNSTGVGTLGRVSQVRTELGNATVDSHVTIVRPKKEIDPYFFGYSMFNKQKVIDLIRNDYKKASTIYPAAMINPINQNKWFISP